MGDVSASEAFGVVRKEVEPRRNKAENRRQKEEEPQITQINTDLKNIDN